ncbi:MAG: MarR family EPS-associated transcriptional regulator [Leptospirales bacterium]
MYEDEIEYRLLKTLEGQPDLSQRDLAGKMNLSLGKINFCIQALVKKGLVKANNFRNSKNKIAYFYKLTPIGIEQKTRLTVRFLQKKMVEYDSLKLEIDELQEEVNRLSI